jgi:hypothetical protein
MQNLSLDEGETFTSVCHGSTFTHSFEEHEAFMSEIQLRGIVDKNGQGSLVSRH